MQTRLPNSSIGDQFSESNQVISDVDYKNDDDAISSKDMTDYSSAESCSDNMEYELDSKLDYSSGYEIDFSSDDDIDYPSMAMETLRWKNMKMN